MRRLEKIYCREGLETDVNFVIPTNLSIPRQSNYIDDDVCWLKGKTQSSERSFRPNAPLKGSQIQPGVVKVFLLGASQCFLCHRSLAISNGIETFNQFKKCGGVH
ncbi:unnamed protein product [Leptosia nina]|uniref:Uncharacterized protein n=1 Tax=Leptosia nina TaxID=320188 RepID=A0AAV1J459_9NEOP